MQDLALARLSPSYAPRLGIASPLKPYRIPSRPIDPATLFSITEFWPPKNGVGQDVLVDGYGFTANCVVVFDGVEQPTNTGLLYLGILFFTVRSPGNEPRGGRTGQREGPRYRGREL